MKLTRAERPYGKSANAAGAPTKTGVGFLEKVKAKIIDGWVKCPRCSAKLARIYYGGSGHGIEFKCKCGTVSVLETGGE